MRRALCVGINAYPAPNQLSGCVNDAEAWAAYLARRKFGVTMLTDRQATRLGILGAFAEMMQGTKRGDVLALVYSGHGTYIRDLDGDEGDGYDEALVPVDFEQGKLIIDDDLRALTDSVPDGVTLTVFLDSCYSGTATRLLGMNALQPGRNRVAAAAARRKFMPLPQQAVNAYLHERTLELTELTPRTSKVLLPDQMRHVTVSACLPQEVAWEADGEGVFTTAALEVLSKSGPTLTLHGFLQRVHRHMGADRWQTPTLDGPLSMLKQTLVRGSK